MLEHGSRLRELDLRKGPFYMKKLKITIQVNEIFKSVKTIHCK
jgi:hypothetical protein